MVIHANILANFLAPFAVTPLPTMYVWCCRPFRSTDFSTFEIASATKKFEKQSWIYLQGNDENE